MTRVIGFEGSPCSVQWYAKESSIYLSTSISSLSISFANKAMSAGGFLHSIPQLKPCKRQLEMMRNT